MTTHSVRLQFFVRVAVVLLRHCGEERNFCCGLSTPLSSVVLNSGAPSPFVIPLLPDNSVPVVDIRVGLPSVRTR